MGIVIGFLLRGGPGQSLSAAETIEEVQASVFHRAGTSSGLGIVGWFADPPESFGLGRAGWRVPMAAGSKVALELSYQPREDGWTGWMRLDRWQGEVMLRRTAAFRLVDPLVGTWRAQRGADIRCLHVVQGGDGFLLGWRDWLIDMRKVRWAPGLRPQPMVESYGRPVTVMRDPAGFVTLEEATARVFRGWYGCVRRQGAGDCWACARRTVRGESRTGCGSRGTAAVERQKSGPS